MKRVLIPLFAAIALPNAVNADWGLFGCAEENISEVVDYYRSGYRFSDALRKVNFNDVKRCRVIWKQSLVNFHGIATPSINVNWR